MLNLAEEFPKCQDTVLLIDRPLPTFAFIVDETDIPVARWHSQNEGVRPCHYSTMSRYVSSPVFVSPRCRLLVQAMDGERKHIFAQYVVITKNQLERELINWHRYSIAPSFASPTLIAAQPNSITYPGKPQTINLANHLRLAFLLAPKVLPMQDLLHLTQTLKYNHQPLETLVNSEPGTRLSLLLLHQYSGALEEVNVAGSEKHFIEAAEAEILAGRYQPVQFGDGRVGHGDRLGEGDVREYTEASFKWSFDHPEDKALVKDLTEKTAPHMAVLARQTLLPPWTKARGPLPAEVQEALAILRDRKLRISHTYTNIAHMALYNQLPTSFQSLAINASARKRLNRILNPFSMLDENRGRVVLGGPLPWENQCIVAAMEALQRRGRKSAVMADIVSQGPIRSVKSATHRWLGRSLLA